jgi:hypothetical protein
MLMSLTVARSWTNGRAYLPDLTVEEARTLYGEWLDHYRARCAVEQGCTRGRPKLLAELDALKKRRTHLPRLERGAIDACIEAIGRELGAVPNGFRLPPAPPDMAAWS